jgi:hypothetical protein
VSDLVTIGKIVIDWLLDRNVKRTAQLDEYLRMIQLTCVELVEIQDPLSDKAALLHEQLKVIYELASQRLPRALIDREGWDLYRGLSSARIYFWMRVVDSARAAGQLQDLLSERRALSSPSFDALLRMLPEPYSDLNVKSLSQIREQCLKDIARILELRPFF